MLHKQPNPQSAFCAIELAAPHFRTMDQNAMDQATFFHGVSKELLDVFEKGFSPEKLRTGEALFEQEEYGDRLYVLDAGLLEVSVYSAQGRKLSLNQLRPGSVFGEIAFYDPGPRTARIEALEPCNLRSIGQPVLTSQIADKPTLAMELLGLAGKRMRWMSQQMEDQVFLTPAARLAAKLLYLAGENTEINMAQAQLADYVGVTRELVSKTLSEWRREGTVTLSRGRIEIIDVDALTETKDSIFFSSV
jgi:CRP/FNR family cyclic AMP-dependent transcriptional regulator